MADAQTRLIRFEDLKDFCQRAMRLAMELALAHEVLSAVLGGGKRTINIKSLYEKDDSGIQGTCHSFLALDPNCFVGRAQFKRAMDAYIDTIKNSGAAEGVAEIFLPGEIEARTEQRCLAQGVPLAEATARDLETLAKRLGLSLRFA